MKQATIIVRNTLTGWVADFSSHPEGPETFRLFGTFELPLALTSRASFELVVETLAKGHPGSQVIEASSKSQLRRITRQTSRPADTEGETSDQAEGRLTRSQALSQLHEAAKVLGIVLISGDLSLEGRRALGSLREALGHLDPSLWGHASDAAPRQNSFDR
jgi:hypothetical protein